MKADITVVATGYMEALDKGGGQLNQYIFFHHKLFAIS